MGHFDLFSQENEDRKLLKYFWFFTFFLHLIFIGMGVYWLNESYSTIDLKMIGTGELRMDMLIIAIFMESVAFSVTLLVLSIYVYVLHGKIMVMQNMLAAIYTSDSQQLEPVDKEQSNDRQES